MKKFIYLTVCGLFMGFLMSCATSGTERMLRNSNGYDHTNQTEENKLKIDGPDWASQGGFSKWKEKNEETGTYLYFLGSSVPIFNDLIKEGKNYWTLNDATNEAWREGMGQISNYVYLEIQNSYQDRISELSKQGGTEQNGVTVADLKQYQAEEEVLLKFQSNSSTTFEGMRPDRQYTETWERTFIENKAQRIITATKCWIIFAISKEEISKARQRISDERQKRFDEKMRWESLENREEQAFLLMSRQYNNVINDLNDPDISTNEDDKLFSERYNALLHISARLRTLTTLETRNDATGESYRNLMQVIGNDIREYNPNDRQNKLIQDLRTQIRDRDIRLDELRDKRVNEIIAGRQGYNLQSQTIIISFPQKPNETNVSDVNIFAANDMVSNIDYISFTNANGVNNIARAEEGLYTPVISVSWTDAARYCNWLSKIHGYTPCYGESRGRITAYNSKNNGYRLPEEHEIIAMLNSKSDIIDEAEFTNKGIWCSTGFPQDYLAYTLSGGTGAAEGRLGKQSFTGTTPDAGIGFRVVRNAK